MVLQLTQGAIGDLMSGRNVDKPLLQLLGIKRLTSDVERYRLVVSDGTHYSGFFMLSTAFNDRITNGELRPLTVIRVEKFACNRIGPEFKWVAIILELKVVANDPKLEKIGYPIPISDIRTIFPISSLRLHQNEWAICARVISKTSIRTWNVTLGDRYLFSAIFVDDSGEIRAHSIDAECDKFFDVLQEGKMFYVSNAELKSNNNNNCEIMFHKDTVVECRE